MAFRPEDGVQRIRVMVLGRRRAAAVNALTAAAGDAKACSPAAGAVAGSAKRAPRQRRLRICEFIFHQEFKNKWKMVNRTD
jgi:hypothetical protein